MRKISLLLVAISFALLVASCGSTKNAGEVSEVQRLRNDGWMNEPGGLPLDQMLQQNYDMIKAKDASGDNLYITSSGNGVGTSVSTAKMQALALAKSDIASQISSNIAKLVSANLGNSQLDSKKAASVSEIVSSSKEIVAAKLGRVDIPMILIRDFESCQQSKTAKNKLDQGMVEVQVKMFYNTANGNKVAMEEIKKVLKEKVNANEEELKKLMGQ